MFRAKTVLAAAITVVAGVFVLPACHKSEDDTPVCSNGTKDDGEEGVDCGGTCTAKCTGAVCAGDGECGSGHCVADVCAAPTGKPCGVGVTPPVCAEGEQCELDKDCASSFCDGSKCAIPAAGSHSDGKKNGGETGVDCGGSVKTTQPCPDGQGCTDSTDCVGTCNAGICGPIGPMDGKKDNGETDVDCGGANAPKCDNGKSCDSNTDCTDAYCADATKKCTAPTYDDGVMNGSETDIDCGGTGTGMKKCAETKACLVDTDCNGACNYKKACVDIPSCKGQYGGETCGTFETPDAFKNHESCCKTLPVGGYTDSNEPGKKVYLDKYEITAGRMRAFLETLGGGVDAAGNAKNADVKAWLDAHKPSRWNDGWSSVLPTANIGSAVNYTVSSPTVDPLYPGQDRYSSTVHLTDWMDNSGNYTIDVGIFHALGALPFFPEFTAVQTSPNYSETHALNCTNTTNFGGGQSTYWFDDATINTYSEDGSKGKFFTKDQMDEKALNCSPVGLFAAFCAWDGGQLATAEVMDYVTGNTNSPVYGPNFIQNGKLAPGNSVCGGSPHSLITFMDGASYPCSDVYLYPNDMGNDFDFSYKVAPGGRIPADAIAMNVGDEPWMDLIGNLQEAVMKAGETSRFDWRGYGHEYNSIQYHRLQMSTPRGKGGAFGARCMRFK